MTRFADRTRRLQVLLNEGGWNGLVVTDLVNIRYLTGFTGSNALLMVPVNGEPTFLTDGRYADQAKSQVWVDDQRTARVLIDEARKTHMSGWVAETHSLNVDTWQALGELPSAGRLVESLRLIKDSYEIAALREACKISTAALERLLAGPLRGISERDLALKLETLMRELGADDRAFDTIVAAGSNSAIPHHEPTDRVITTGDFLKIDFGARIDGYHADCTRTVVIGKAAPWQHEIHAAVRAAQAIGVAALQPGAELAEVNSVVRSSLKESGWLESFTTGLGHGVGLLIHEDPFFSAQAVGRIERRMVLTMEPGIYLADRGGVRIEDTVLVNEAGPEVLTDLTTELMEIG